MASKSRKSAPVVASTSKYALNRTLDLQNPDYLETAHKILLEEDEELDNEYNADEANTDAEKHIEEGEEDSHSDQNETVQEFLLGKYKVTKTSKVKP